MLTNLLTKLKTFFSDVKNNLITILTVAVGILLVILKFKSDDVTELQTQIDELKTQKEADVLETQIKQQMNNAAANQQSIDQYQQALDALEKKRQDISNNDNPEDFWKNN